MGKKLVFIGGGHAHMEALAKMAEMVAQGYEIVLIAPSEYHYYSGMGPGMLGGTYAPSEIRFKTRQVVQKAGGLFIRDQAIGINPDNRQVILKSGGTVDYQVLSCNVGSYVPQDLIAQSTPGVYPVKPIAKLRQLQTAILTKARKNITRIVIIGGGPSAAEIAGNIWQLTKTNGCIIPQIKILAGARFMSRFSEKVRRKIMALMKHRNIIIVEGEYASRISGAAVRTRSGLHLGFDLAVIATGVKPSPLFRKSGLPTGPDGGLLVNKFLQSVKFPDIFGGGDCICFQDSPLDKVGVYAVRQNPVLLHNILAQPEGRQLKAFDPGGPYLLIFNLGGGMGLLHKKRLTLAGRLAFKIKDKIDRHFMARYKSIE